MTARGRDNRKPVALYTTPWCKGVLGPHFANMYMYNKRSFSPLTTQNNKPPFNKGKRGLSHFLLCRWHHIIFSCRDNRGTALSKHLNKAQRIITLHTKKMHSISQQDSWAINQFCVEISTIKLHENRPFASTRITIIKH